MPSKYPEFIFERAGHWCFYRNKALQPFESAAPTDVESPISPFLSERQEINSSQHSHVYRAVLNYKKQTFPVYFKGIDFKSSRDLIKQQFSKSRAIKAFEAELLLQALGFSTPTTLLTGWRQRMLFFKSSFFTLSAALTGYEDLYTIADQLGKQPPHQKRVFIEQLAVTIARLHIANIGHGDLRAGNVMCKYSEEWQFSLIDNERTRKYRKLPERIRIKNLVQLNLLFSPYINKTDRQRFFYHYSLICYGQTNNNLLTKVIEKTRQRLKVMVEKQKIEASDLWL